MRNATELPERDSYDVTVPQPQGPPLQSLSTAPSRLFPPPAIWGHSWSRLPSGMAPLPRGSVAQSLWEMSADGKAGGAEGVPWGEGKAATCRVHQSGPGYGETNPGSAPQ